MIEVSGVFSIAPGFETTRFTGQNVAAIRFFVWEGIEATAASSFTRCLEEEGFFSSSPAGDNTSGGHRVLGM